MRRSGGADTAVRLALDADHHRRARHLPTLAALRDLFCNLDSPRQEAPVLQDGIGERERQGCGPVGHTSHERVGGVCGEGHAALVHDAPELLLELDVDGVAVFGGSVSADAQLLLVDGFFERTVDHRELARVIVEARDGAPAKLVRADLVGERFGQAVELLRREKKLVLDSLEHIWRIHGVAPFRVFEYNGAKSRKRR